MSGFDQPLPFMDKVFWPKMACFSFLSWLKHGIGFCVIKEAPDSDHSKKLLEDILEYVPYELDSANTPDEAILMLDAYDPYQENSSHRCRWSAVPSWRDH